MGTVSPLTPLWLIRSRRNGTTSDLPMPLDRAEQSCAILNRTFGSDFRPVPYRVGKGQGSPRGPGPGPGPGRRVA